ncbi:PepSY-associated TM helix domain-containing protein [Sphingomonas sp. H160509]|uniref:PepSY-associated TM helix domain-containing protein n=1 Tax=Sphingomonas sp. H160509 TaxID=2955313 RepID=UPI0031596B0F
MIYLWRPQLEAWLDQPYYHLPVAGRTVSPDAQVRVALAAVPRSSLHKYVLPEHPGNAVRVIVSADGVDHRVYVDPHSLAVLKVIGEEDRPLNVVSRLHGELLAGVWGSYLVEIAACWAIVMLLTGLYLWWPRNRKGLAGVPLPSPGARPTRVLA